MNYQNSEFIAFKCDISNEKAIFDIVNRILEPGIKINSLDEIWETILSEISYGFLVEKQLPYISLHFNKNALIYSVMYDYYKTTLVGHILTFLDFFLKGFSNGGFFKEDFVYKWYKESRNEDYKYLIENFISMKKYLFENNLSNLSYNSLNDSDFSIKYNNKQAFESSSRIIGKMEENLGICDNILFPKCDYIVEGDFDVYPEVIAQLKKDNNNISEYLYKAIEIKQLLHFSVATIMNKIPYFKGYFYLLNMITFAIHYLPNLRNNNKFPELKNSLANKIKGQYVRRLPTLFPPLPIPKKKIINPQCHLGILINMLQKSTQNELNNEIGKQKNSKGALLISEGLKKKICEEIPIKYKEYLITLVKNKEEIIYRTDYELKIKDVLHNIFFNLHLLRDAPFYVMNQNKMKIKNKKI